ncbi:hypothetical protein C5167_002263 [Papaver somniferum]|uniref:Uncharacterized protein n=1 Tax=Papaver somniferum TaxID=3469 RepID=A0A4Y7KYX6_PAPSO|nr:hypothetical protein C5167_002263 [Papaver somniferum]
MQNEDGLILFNSLLERVKFVKIHGTKGLRTTVSYVPSLVSLNSGTYVEQRRNKRQFETCSNLKRKTIKGKMTREFDERTVERGPKYT